MANEQLFDDLIGAIQSSIIQANEMAEHQHISLLEEYFDKEHNPVCVDVNLPFHNPQAQNTPIYKKVSIPKLCLVPLSSLKMKEIEVNFEVKFTQLMNELEGDGTDEKRKKSKSLFSFNNRTKDGYSDMAKVTIKFEGTNPPEGIMRINDHLTRLIP